MCGDRKCWEASGPDPPGGSSRGKEDEGAPHHGLARIDR